MSRSWSGQMEYRIDSAIDRLRIGTNHLVDESIYRSFLARDLTRETIRLRQHFDGRTLQ